MNAKRFLPGLSLSTRKALQGFLFTLPCVIGIALFFFWPMLKSLYTSFSYTDMQNQTYTQTFIGIENYRQAINVDPEFRQKLATSIIGMVTTVPLVMIFSFFIATVLNRKFKGRSIARMILFLPVIIYSAAMTKLDSSDILQVYMGGSTFKSLFAASEGVFSFNIGQYLLSLGVAENVVGFIVGSADRIYSVAKLSGIQILIFLAGLQSVPPSLYEASSIEGATSWEDFWLITFPMVSPLILTCFIYTVIDTFTSSENVVMETIRSVGFGNMNFGLSSAMAWIYFIIILLFIGLIGVLGIRKVFYYDK